MWSKLKTSKEYRQQINNLIKEYSKIDERIKNMKVDIAKYCKPSSIRYRVLINYRIKNFTRCKEKEKEYNRSDRKKEVERMYMERLKINDIERFRERNRRNRRIWIKNNPERYKEKTKKSFERWTLNNSKKAMSVAWCGTIARAAISKLNIRPDACPHCWRDDLHIDFHHPNHKFWWIWTFCCRSCHYYFNRDRVVPSDKIIDLKKLLEENNSH